MKHQTRRMLCMILTVCFFLYNRNNKHHQCAADGKDQPVFWGIDKFK